jgi:hypothetical protein
MVYFKDGDTIIPIYRVQIDRNGNVYTCIKDYPKYTGYYMLYKPNSVQQARKFVEWLWQRMYHGETCINMEEFINEVSGW